nr:MAG TPA: hypothetical protein [Herelleviridae sp.]
MNVMRLITPRRIFPSRKHHKPGKVRQPTL